MKADITLLRQQVESFEERRSALRETFAVAEKQLAKLSKASRVLCGLYFETIHAAFDKAFPDVREAVKKLEEADSDFGDARNLAAVLTDPDCGGDDDPAYVLGYLNESVLQDESVDRLCTGLSVIESALVNRGAEADVTKVARAIADTREVIGKSRVQPLGSVDEAWDLIEAILDAVAAVLTEVERASDEIGYQLVLADELRRAKRGNRKENRNGK